MPHHFGQHTKGDDDKQVGVDCSQRVDKVVSFQPFGLKYGQAFLDGISLDVALHKVLAASGRLVGHSYDGCHVVATVNEFCKACYGKFRSAEKYYFEVLFSH